MKVGTIVKTSFIIILLLTVIGVYLKITHAAGAETLLIVCVIPGLIFKVSAIYEVRTSTGITPSEKNIWTVAFVLLSGIAGLIYFIIGRRRIAAATSH